MLQGAASDRHGNFFKDLSSHHLPAVTSICIGFFVLRYLMPGSIFGPSAQPFGLRPLSLPIFTTYGGPAPIPAQPVQMHFHLPMYIGLRGKPATCQIMSSTQSNDALRVFVSHDSPQEVKGQDIPFPMSILVESTLLASLPRPQRYPNPLPPTSIFWQAFAKRAGASEPCLQHYCPPGRP
jgi:hypothetical protein